MENSPAQREAHESITIRLVSPHNTPRTLFIIGSLVIVLAGWQGHRLGLTLAQKNEFDPSPFVEMSFQFPCLLAGTGIAQWAIVLLSPIGANTPLFKPLATAE